MGEWKRVKIGDVCTIEKGVTGLAKALPGDYPLVTTGAERKTSRDYQFDTKAVCIPLVSSTGHGKKTLNYVHYQEGKFALGSILSAVVPRDETILDARYLHVYLQKNKDRVLVPLMKGAANVSLSMTAISNIEVPLPSLVEQKKILGKIDSISNEHEDFLNESDVQIDLFGKLHQAVLQEAIEGKLTAKWRKQNPELISGDNHTSKVLEKIKAEKECLTKNTKITKKAKALPPISEDEKPFDLPEGWVWCRLGEIASIRGGKRVSNGYKLLKAPTPHIYIRVSDMKNGSIDDSDLHYIDEKMYQLIKQYTINKDDLYMTIVGATIGKCGIVPEQFDNMNLTENAAKVSMFLVNKFFLLYCLNSDFCQNQFVDKTKQVGVQKMALNRFSTTVIPIPPLAEQQAIVERADNLMAMIEDLEKQVSERKEQSEMLMQSVLREAFAQG